MTTLLPQKATRFCALGKTSKCLELFIDHHIVAYAGFLVFFDKLLSFASNNAYTLTIGGDLYIDVLKDSAPAVDLLITLQCNGFGFRNEITMPASVTTTSTSLLDLFITNTVAENVISRVIISDLSDHLPIMLILE